VSIERPDLARQRFIAAARLNAFLIASLGRKPGEAMDETDKRLYQRELRPLYEGIRTGQLLAAFEKTPEGVDVPAGSCSAEVWQLIFFVRNAEFRPSFEALGKRVREALGQPTEALGGGEATARRVITAPGPARLLSGALPVPGVVAFLDPDAAWVLRFAREVARGDDKVDGALLTLLARLPSDSARERAMTELLIAREADATLRASRERGQERTGAGRSADRATLQAALDVVRVVREERAQ
jgi:hypothetical protein